MTEQNTTELTPLERLSSIAVDNPEVYAIAFAWLAGAGRVNSEVAERIEDAVNYVESTKDIWTFWNRKSRGTG